MENNLKETLSRLYSYQTMLTQLRRDLHAHPELGFGETRTAAVIEQYLRSLGLEVHTGIGRTGVVGILRGQQTDSGRSIGLRADMDAIPVLEKAEHEYRSHAPGVMHGCGHDGHMAVLLGAARYLAETRRFNGTAYFIFQPGEEGHAGARAMIEDGLFTRFQIDKVFALHNWPALGAGHIGLNHGPMMAAIDRFQITVRGKGGHGAHPHQAVDPIVAASHIVAATQSIVSRNVDPIKAGVISFQAFIAGNHDALSVIPETAVLSGMTKWFDEPTKHTLRSRLIELAKHTAAAHGADAEVTYEELYPPTINTPDEAHLVRDVAEELFGSDSVHWGLDPSMGSEDFAFMLQERPGAYFRLGQGDQGGRFLHHPEYDFNDETIPAGAAVFARIVEKGLPL